ncbi:hypothetical protein BH24ACT5_BH24ACT5_13660 [soil metagenome]
MSTPTWLPPFDEIVPAAPYRELHHRLVAAPIEDVWPHCLDVTAPEIRTLGPLMALRSLPARIMGKGADLAWAPRPLLDVFTEEGFVLLRRDSEPRDGRASIVFGGAGRFWSVRNNAPIAFPDGDTFIGFDEPGHAKTIARLDAVDLGDGTTRIETETLVAGTDPASTRRFRPYWALIRLPSGLIRRSWLAAIDRRTRR